MDVDTLVRFGAKVDANGVILYHVLASMSNRDSALVKGLIPNYSPEGMDRSEGKCFAGKYSAGLERRNDCVYMWTRIECVKRALTYSYFGTRKHTEECLIVRIPLACIHELDPDPALSFMSVMRIGIIPHYWLEPVDKVTLLTY